MLAPINLANFLAKKSCSKWNKIRPLRVLCRYGYRSLAENPYIETGPYASCGDIRNTYPWPYRDERFAAWKEEFGALVTDPSRMVIRHATSYCAWKIREATGIWPTKPVIPESPEHAAAIARRERPRDARYWEEFLEAQGFQQISADLHNGCHYVGVNPRHGEYGLVVWFESSSDNGPPLVTVSTYLYGRFWCGSAVMDQYHWYKID